MLTDKEMQTLRNLGNESEAAADEIAQLRAAADAVLREAQFYGTCYGVTPHGRAAMELLAGLLRPNPPAKRAA